MQISNKFESLKTESNVEFNYSNLGKEYTVQIVYPNDISNYNIPYILVLPKNMKENCILAVESNNLETENSDDLLNNGLLTAHKLVQQLKDNDNPVLIPIVPSVKNGIPYYQQLSKECFSIPSAHPFYRIDLQVLNIINEVKQNLSDKINLRDKIFLNGYSSSGVFAQRFALLHPEIVDTLCVGGASGSIPVPILELGYPLGIADYYEITEKQFDLEVYSQIKFRYYIGQFEDKRKTSERYDESGNFAPMHDMSYFDRSVPTPIGHKQRAMFGTNLLERSNKQITLMKEMGMDIEQQIFEGRTHNNYNGIGVNELGDEYVNHIYNQSAAENKKL